MSVGAPAGPSLRQLVVGLVALPLSLLPFLAYTSLTPEGRLVRDRALVAVSPPSLPELSGPQKAAARARAPRYQGGVMVLAYHGIGSASDGEGGFVVSPERFGEHLATLRAGGMRHVTAAQVARAFQQGRALPPNAVMLTFDDGRTDAMLFADPLLKQARMAATMFVIAGAASSPGVYYASWDRLEGYVRSGRWDLQSHTTDLHREHEAEGGSSLPALTSRAPGESLAEYRARVADDLDRADAAIEAHTGRRPVAFAYPFGAYGADRTNDPAIQAVLREEVARRYVLAFHQDEQEAIPLATPDQDRWGLRRLEVENWSGLQLLDHIERAAGLSGLSRDDDPLADLPWSLLGPPLAASPAPAGTGLAPAPPPAARASPARAGAAAPTSPAVRPPRGAVVSGPGPVAGAPSPGGSAPAPPSAPATTTTTVRPPPTTSPPARACTHSPSGKGPRSCPPGKGGA